MSAILKLVEVPGDGESRPGAAVPDIEDRLVPFAAAIEEDIFIRAVSHAGGSRSLSIAGCRILARQFRERVEAREARARDRIGVSLACPFDL
ncbi:MAG: hypothetical protein PHI71_08060 [Acidiphilium sp.]|nr:hypothetical protein [Acidiphilium sp.]